MSVQGAWRRVARRRGGAWRRVALGIGAASGLLSAAAWGQPAGASLIARLPPARSAPAVIVCATPEHLAMQWGLRFSTPIEDQAPLGVQVFPPVLSPDRTADFRVVVEFVGDLETLTFRQVDANETRYTLQTWERTTTRVVDGILISIFDRTVPASVLQVALRYRHGHALPRVPLGEVELPAMVVSQEPPGDEDEEDDEDEIETRWIQVRMAPTNLPASEVRVFTPPPAPAESRDLRVAAAQYASHVVNLHVPGFGDERVLDGDQAYPTAALTRALYWYLADDYDIVAVLPEMAPLSDWGGFHGLVKNDVTGIGVSAFDSSSRHGSAGVLRGTEYYAPGAAFMTSTLLHEIGHQHGDFYELATLLGLEAAGHEPSAHMALSTGGETLIGAVLEGTRAVMPVVADGAAGAAGFEVVRAGPPLTYHPLQLYRMGLLDVANVPDLEVFERQDQFDAETSATPDPGTPVEGGGQPVTTNRIHQEFGFRGGPVLNPVRLAFVVVSRDGLLPSEAMNWYNFYAQRMEAATGTRSVEGYASYAEATRGVGTLTTAIVPLRDPPIHQPLPVSDAAFGRKDWRGLVLDEPFPPRFTAGQPFAMRGQVDPDIHGTTDFVAFIIRWSRHGAADDEEDVIVQAPVRGGEFTIEDTVPRDPGAYRVDMFLYETFESSATTTGTLAPIFVDTAGL